MRFFLLAVLTLDLLSKDTRDVVAGEENTPFSESTFTQIDQSKANVQNMIHCTMKKLKNWVEIGKH